MFAKKGSINGNNANKGHVCKHIWAQTSLCMTFVHEQMSSNERELLIQNVRNKWPMLS